MPCVARTTLAFGLCLLLDPTLAQAADKNVIHGIDIENAPGEGDSNARIVRIRTAQEPTFTVFRLNDPMRIVVDISGGDLSEIAGPVVVEDGVLGQVATRQFSTGGFLIGRIIVGFETETSYDVQAQGNAVVLRTGYVPASQIERAIPPPAAPVDRLAAERFQQAEQEANAAAERARAEREQAERAASYAQEQQAQAQRMAQEAEHIAREAQKAKQDAERLRALAQEALLRDRENAMGAAQSAEGRLAELKEATRAVEAQRATAERLALKAQRAQREAEEAAAKAEAEHKTRVAELRARMAEAESQQKTADAARARAEAAQKEALEAQKALEAARLRTEQTREEIRTKLAEIEAREQRAQQALERAAAERQAVALKQEQVSAEAQRLAGVKQKLDKERDSLQEAKRRIEEEAQRVADAKRRLAAHPSTSDSGASKDSRARAEVVRLMRVGRAPAGAHGAGQEGVLLVLTDNAEYESKRIEAPPRLVIDLKGVKRGTAQTTYSMGSALLKRVRLGDHAEKARVVLDLRVDGVQHEITRVSEGLLVTLKATEPSQNAAKATPTTATSDNEDEEADVEPAGEVPTYTAQGRSSDEEPEADSKGSAASAQQVAAQSGEALPPAANGQQPATVREVRFSGHGHTARIEVDMGTFGPRVAHHIDARSSKAWVLTLVGANVPKSLERSLDASAYGTVVRLVSTYQAARAPQPIVKVVATLTGHASFDLFRRGGALVWEITRQSGPPAAASTAAPQTAGFAAEAAVLARSTPTQERTSKKRINIDLKDADIAAVIRFIAEESGENIITSDDVTGKVTLRLRNVPWDKALDTILRTKGYDKIRQNNILRVAPAEVLQREREAELAKREAETKVEDTLIKIITVNYASATDIVVQLKPLMSPRGSVQTDARTNTIIVEDVRSNIGRLVELTRRLDRQTPQVLIEARIVEASSTHIQEIGIQWGGTGQATSRAGNPTGLAFPGDVIVSGAADDLTRNITTGVGSPARYAVNLPAPIGAGAGGGIGFQFGSFGGSQLLNLRLSAMEQSGSGRIISSPRVATLDNKTAKISQGIDIPITVVSAAGANTRYIPANLELEVTPHVTNDGIVSMRIRTQKAEPDFARTGAAGDPSIVKKFAETEVQVQDGETTVIGGIYTRTTSEKTTGVPFLSKIPILGHLFRNHREEDVRAELLVFITPRIVNRQAALMPTEGEFNAAPNAAPDSAAPDDVGPAGVAPQGGAPQSAPPSDVAPGGVGEQP